MKPQDQDRKLYQGLTVIALTLAAFTIAAVSLAVWGPQ